MDAIFGGWTVNGVFRAQSGIPFQIFSSSCNVPGQLSAMCLPGLLSGASPYAQSPNNIDPNKRLLEPSTHLNPYSFNFYTGDGPRVQNFRQPGYRDFDMGLQKVDSHHRARYFPVAW